MTPTKKLRTQVIDEHGIVIREGNIRSTDADTYLFGLPISDWFKAGSVFISATIIATSLWVNMDARVKLIEGALTENNRINIAFTDYIKNADNFNSMVYRTRFLNGAPADDGFEIGGSNVNGSNGKRRNG